MVTAGLAVSPFAVVTVTGYLLLLGRGNSARRSLPGNRLVWIHRLVRSDRSETVGREVIPVSSPSEPMVFPRSIVRPSLPRGRCKSVAEGCSVKPLRPSGGRLGPAYGCRTLVPLSTLLRVIHPI